MSLPPSLLKSSDLLTVILMPIPASVTPLVDGIPEGAAAAAEEVCGVDFTGWILDVVDADVDADVDAKDDG